MSHVCACMCVLCMNAHVCNCMRMCPYTLNPHIYTYMFTHTQSVLLSLSLTHTYTLSVLLSLSHTHTHRDSLCSEFLSPKDLLFFKYCMSVTHTRCNFTCSYIYTYASRSVMRKYIRHVAGFMCVCVRERGTIWMI